MTAPKRSAMAERACLLLAEGLTTTSVAETLGTTKMTAKTFVRLLSREERERRAKLLASNATPPEKVEEIIGLLDKVDTIQEISQRVGVRRGTVRSIVRPILDMQEAAGTNLLCSCGAPKFHPNIAICRQPESRRQQARSPEAMLAIEMLTAGHRTSDVAAALGMNPRTMETYVRRMTPEQRAERDRLKGWGRAA